MTRDSLLTTRRIDAICGEFETSWRSGQRTQVETIVAEVEPADRSSLLADLIALEFELRREQGEAVQAAEYVRRFPDDEDAVVAALAQVTGAEATRTPASSRNHADSGPQAARYRLGEQVGAGGMGVVVRARDEPLDRDLAVKILADHLQTRREAVERFLREARICAQLQHPGIIPVHDLGWLGERPYFAMKLVTGRSLADLLQDRSHPDQDLPRLLEIFDRVCETVAAQQATAKIKGRPAHVAEACVFSLESWRSLFKHGAPPIPWIDSVLDGIDDNAWRRMVRQACRDQDWAAVSELLERAQDEPLSVDAVNVVAMKLMDAKQFELALRLLQAAQPNQPRDFWINEYLAVVFFSLPDRRLEESVRFFTAALAIRETEAAYLNLGVAFFDLERYSEAERAFRSALRLQPDYVQAHLFLADVLQRQGQTAEAADVRKRAAQLQQPGKQKADDARDAPSQLTSQQTAAGPIPLLRVLAPSREAPPTIKRAPAR